MLETEKEGGRKLNRPRWEGGNGRYWDKMRKKQNWYKKRPETGEGEEKQNRGDHSIKRGGREIVVVGKVPQEKE